MRKYWLMPCFLDDHGENARGNDNDDDGHENGDEDDDAYASWSQ